MKKLIYILLIAPFLLFSCKKERGFSAKQPASKKYAITVNVANFTQKQGTFALRKGSAHLASTDTITNLNGYIDEVAYVVVDTNFAVIKTIRQDSTMANLGTITDSLAAGRYYIYVVAGKKGLRLTAPTDAYDYGANAWQDTFWGGIINLIVGDHNLSKTVILTRAVGKLELQVTDNIPANADSLFITVSADAIQKNILDSAFFNTRAITFPVAIPAAAKGHANFTIDRLIGAIDQNFDLSITCKDSTGTVIGSGSASPVKCYANKRTVLTGTLFGNTTIQNSQTFTVKIDTTWGGSSTISF
jgi:hypothetical protein